MTTEVRYKIIEGLDQRDAFDVGRLLGHMNRLNKGEVQQVTVTATITAIERVQDSLELTENANYNFVKEPAGKDSFLCTITLKKAEE